MNRATRIADAVRAALLHLPVTSNSVSFIIAAQLGRKGVPVDFFLLFTLLPRFCTFFLVIGCYFCVWWLFLQKLRVRKQTVCRTAK